MRGAHLFFAAMCMALGAAIPGNAMAAADGGLPRRPALGASLADAPSGPSIAAVRPGSAAATAGLHQGDVISSLNGAATHSAADVVAGVRRTGAGKRLALAISRGGAGQRIRILLPEAPREQGSGFVTDYGAVKVRSALQRTLLTLPSPARTKPPVLLIVGGIGCLSVDVAGDPGDAYQDLAHDLARAGIATLRVEKTGVGDSQGPPCSQSDFRLESEGYAAALDALRHDRRVDPQRIYLLGHSIGSLISPALAAAAPVRGIVVAEGVGRNWFEYELANLRRQLELGGDAPAKVDSEMAAKERCMHWLLIEGEDEPKIEAREPDCRAYNSYPASADYMRQAAAVNVAGLWEKLPPIPVLAIHGDADIVTDPADHRRIVEVVRAHKGAASFTIIPGMDHHLRHAGSLAAANQAFAAGRESELPYERRFSETIVDWIRADVPHPG